MCNFKCAIAIYRLLTLTALLLFAAPLSYAQIKMTSPVPPSPEADELIEPEESSQELSVFSQLDDDGQSLLQDLATLSTRDKHATYSYGVAVMLGQSKPWQSLGIEIGKLAGPAWMVGLYVGKGQVDGSGTMADRLNYRASIESMGGGVFGRYYMRDFDFLNFEASAGWHHWRGQLHALGTDDNQQVAPSNVYPFSGRGLALSLAANIGWVTGGGYYFEWTPLGVQVGRLANMGIGYGDASVNQALNHDIQGVRFFGLFGLRVGRLF